MSKNFSEDEPTFVKIPKKQKPYDPDRKAKKRDNRQQQREQKRNG